MEDTTFQGVVHKTYFNEILLIRFHVASVGRGVSIRDYPDNLHTASQKSKVPLTEIKTILSSCKNIYIYSLSKLR